MQQVYKNGTNNFNSHKEIAILFIWESNFKTLVWDVLKNQVVVARSVLFLQVKFHSVYVHSGA